MQFPRCPYDHPYHLPLPADWSHPVVLCTWENKTCCWGMRSSLHKSTVIALRELQTVLHHIVHHLWVSHDCHLEQDDSVVEQRSKWSMVGLFWGWCCCTATAAGWLQPPRWHLLLHSQNALSTCPIHMTSLQPKKKSGSPTNSQQIVH